MAQKKSVHDYKRTKILATIGPATNNRKTITELINKGANGIRLNFSHGDYAERKQQIAWIRSAEKTKNKPVAILQDLQGPKIRLGNLVQPVEVKPGDTIKLAYDPKGREDVLPVQYDLAHKVKPGERVLIFDGKIHTEVAKVKNGVVTLKVKHGGWLMSRKGLNLPDTDLAGDIITAKDREDMRFGAQHGVDYVALSFVQTAEDVKKLRMYLKKLGSNAKIISKIETKAATENLEAIIIESDGVMVARGDLAVETEPESVPIVQRKIIGLAQKYGKISIVATQMLASMVEAPEPTRAEVSDVATAVILGTDAVMLSDETANGGFPLETVTFMKRIIRYAEMNAPVKPLFLLEEDDTIQSSISSAVMTLAHQVKAAAIVVETATGATARSVASHRPSMPIIMLTHDEQVGRQLALVYGGKSYIRPKSEQSAEKVTKWLTKEINFKKGDMVVITMGLYPGLVGGTDTIKVRKIV